MAEARIERLTVPPNAAPAERLDRWLGAHLPDFSRSAAQRLIREGRVRVNGRVETKGSAAVRPGDAVEVELPAPLPAQPAAQEIALDIVYEDPHLLVLNKPVGMVVHPAAGNREGTLVNALLHHCRGLSAIGGVERPGIVHRLDKATSGLLVVAKSDGVHRSLSAQVASREMKRLYAAVVWGRPEPPSGLISAPVGRHPRDRKRMAVVATGRRAVTHYRTVFAAGGLAHVEAALETGRTHQIRVHFAHLNHPVVGDRQYGLTGKHLHERLMTLPPPLRKAAALADHQLLHAYRLKFTHPVTGAPVDFQTELPEDLSRVIEALRGLPKA
jgi:23S rRNA pseudouridine1911/1915/1917 synthase